MNTNQNLPKFSIKFSSLESVKKFSCGEVTEPETISYRTERPYPGGILCQRIFGPIRDYECECGTLKGVKYKNKICTHCGVTVLPSTERFNRMGHISLIRPVVHPLAYTYIARLLQISKTSVIDIAYSQAHLRFVPQVRGNIVTEIDGNIFAGYYEVVYEREEGTKSSPKAIRDALASLKLQEMQTATDDDTHREMISRLIRKDFDPVRYTVEAVAVSPAGGRSIVNMEGFYATSGRNELYQRIIRRNIRLRTILEYDINDEELLDLENTLLHKAVETLYLGGMMESNGVPLAGIIEGLMDKGGLIRGNLLGKRVDYSGRSVITSGPNLKLGQIGLPIKMAYELYKPFVINRIQDLYEVSFAKANEIWELRDHRAFRALEAAVKMRKIVMNRQPTLHRLGVMAFDPVLINDKCIRVHPMVCAAFNADFDGDTVALHMILSIASQREAEQLMSCEANILMSSNGDPTMAPSHEMVIGLYVMTIIKDYRETPLVENSLERIEGMLDTRDEFTNLPRLHINEKIEFRYSDGRRVITTPGRLLLERALGVEVTEPLGKSSIRKLIKDLPNRYHARKCLDILDEVMQLSLKYVTYEGFSVGINDFSEPPTRTARFNKSNEFEKDLKDRVEEGLVESDDSYEQIVREWMGTIKDLQSDYVEAAGEDNPIVMMYRTGARVSMSQISQLVVAKGMIANMANKISEHPIENSLKDGLTPSEYFRSCSGSRKSLADKKFITPISGYLARRLITATRDFGITEEDCGSTKGIRILSKDSFGRFTREGEFISNISDEKYTYVRSPVTCQAHGGICRKCYGVDPSTMAVIRMNTPVGAISAQSLTEPTTQMSMRTFHTSGAATLHDSNKVAKAFKSGKVSLEDCGQFTKISVDELEYFAKKGKYRLAVAEGDTVNAGDLLFSYVNSNLENEDIAGTLPKLEGYFELFDTKLGESAVVAPESGRVSIVLNGDRLKVFVGQSFAGEVTDNVLCVANGQLVEKSDELSIGEVSIKSLYWRSNLDLELTAEVFVRKVVNLYAGDGIIVNPKHIEMVFRAMTEVVIKEDGSKGLRILDKGGIQLYGVSGVGKNYPSWLKAVGFGWIKAILTDALEAGSVSYGTRTEAILSGSRLPEVIR